jgi:hypothetical protein
VPQLRLDLVRRVGVFERGEDEVDRERPAGQLPGLLDRLRNLFERAVGASEDAEAAGVRDGGRELGTGSESEPDRQDRILDAELAAKWRSERDGQEPIIAGFSGRTLSVRKPRISPPHRLFAVA